MCTSCIKCEERVPGCHSLCETYQIDSAKLKARKEKENAARMKEKIADNVQINNCLRTQHKKGGQI